MKSKVGSYVFSSVLFGLALAAASLGDRAFATMGFAVALVAYVASGALFIAGFLGLDELYS